MLALAPANKVFAQTRIPKTPVPSKTITGKTDATTITVSGTVQDETGKAVKDATVSAKGTDTGKATDENGKFSFSVPEGTKTLVVKCIGYKETEAQAGTNITIVIKKSTMQLGQQTGALVMQQDMSIVYKTINNNNIIITSQQEADEKASFPKINEIFRVHIDEEGKVPSGVELLGRGYNVHEGSYADANSVLDRPILDIIALINDGHVAIDGSGNYDYDRREYGESVSKYSENTATSVGLSGNYGFFKASVNTAWSSSQQSEYGRSFASISKKLVQYKVYINPDVDLRYYLTEAYKSDLKSAMDGKKPNGKPYSYANLITDYGTHVLCYAIMGGSVDYYTSTDYSYNLSSSSSKTDVEAGYNSLVVSVNLKIGTKSSNMSSSYNKSKVETLIRRPTIAGAGTDDKWLEKLPKNAVLIDFQAKSTSGDLSLKPIYTVSKNATIWEGENHDVLKFRYTNNSKFIEAYNNYANGKIFPDVSSVPEIECITGLALYKTTSSKVKTAGDPLQIGGNAWKKINYIGGVLSSYYDSDVNYVLYTRTERSSASRPPIVEIYLTDAGIDKENAYEIFKKKYGDDPTAKLYTVPLLGDNPKQLTSSASSPVYPGQVYGVNFNDVGKGRGARIFLNYVTSTRLGPNTQPIRQVRFNKRDVSTPYWIPNNLSGTFFTVMNSKNQEQDSAKGYGNYKDSSRKYSDVYGENYLQYSYDPAK